MPGSYTPPNSPFLAEQNADLDAMRAGPGYKPGGYFDNVEGHGVPTMNGMVAGGFDDQGNPLYVPWSYNSPYGGYSKYRQPTDDEFYRPKTAWDMYQMYARAAQTGSPDNREIAQNLDFWKNQALADAGQLDRPTDFTTPRTAVRRKDLDFR